MNTHAHPRARILAFTLIELITVIAIIAILVALIAPALFGAKHQARCAKAKSTIQAILNASKAYSSDYGKYPPVPGASNAGASGNQDVLLSFGDSAAGCRVNNNELFNVLRAIPQGANTGNALNQRQQSYFEEPKANGANSPKDGFADGQDFNSTVQGQLFDPWGTQYCILLDGDGNGTLKVDSFFSDVRDEIRGGAAAFSLGTDGKVGGKGYAGQYRKTNSSDTPDDIVSW